jgi:hypothetical protein
MKAISDSDILRKCAPRETLGRSFAHANRYEIFREPSPATTVRSRIGSVSSQKRKEDELDDFFEPPRELKKIDTIFRGGIIATPRIPIFLGG